MRKVKAVYVKMETVTLFGKRTVCYAVCSNCMKLIAKYFFLADI
jgi:hypothetical protein